MVDYKKSARKDEVINYEGGSVALKGGRVDVRDIMRQVSRNAGRKIRGKEEDDFVAKAHDKAFREIDAARKKKNLGKEKLENLGNILGKVNRLWNTGYERKITSHRRILGRIIVPIRKALQSEVLRDLAPFRDNQVEFNAHAVRALNAISSEVRAAQKAARELQNRLSADISLIRSSLESLSGRVGKISARLPDFESLANNVAKITARLDENDTQGLDFDYKEFEDRYRGSEAEVSKRLEVYLPLFAGKKSPVVDVGCGRGELLQLFKKHGIGAHGIDTNGDMVKLCKSKGLDARQQDAFEHLGNVKDGALGGVTAIHLIEHLPTKRQIELVKLAFRKLAPGGVLAIETPNPQALSIFANSFYMDPTHQKPVHPLTLEFVMQKAGFENVRVQYLARGQEFREIPVPAKADNAFRDAIKTYNKQARLLHNLVFASPDYACIGTKPRKGEVTR